MNSYFYLFEYPKEIIPQFVIDKKKEKPSSKEVKIYKEFDHLQQEKKKLKSKDSEISKLYLKIDQVQRFFYQPFTSRLYFHFENSGIFLTASNNPDNSYNHSFALTNVHHYFHQDKKNIKSKSKNKKFKDIYFTEMRDDLYVKLKNEDNSLKVEKTYKNHLKTLYQTYDYLEIGGTLCYGFYNIVLYDNISINTFYLLSLLFEKVVITHYYQRVHFMCLGFLGEKRVSKKQFEWIVEHCNDYQIEPKPSEKDIVSIFSFIVSSQNKIITYLFKNNVSTFIRKNFEFDLLTVYQYNHTTSYLKNIQQNYLEYFHYKILHSKIMNLFISFDQKDVKMIYKKIGKKIKDTLQIGLSYGSFTYSFHEHFKKSHFTILDPKQESDWDNMGISFLEDKKVKYDFMESDLMTSFNQLLDQEKKYDCIVLLVDESYENLASYFLFLNTLLKKDGYLLLNSLSKPYLQLEDYIQKSLTFYDHIISQNNIYLYQKNI